MDILHELRAASSQQVRERLPDPPSNSATRTLLSRLYKKGLITRTERDLKYVYAAAISHRQARHSAMARLARVFFDGSMASAVTGMVAQSGEDMSDDELAALEEQIRKARERRNGE